jgi:serine/threonine-protein kinase
LSAEGRKAWTQQGERENNDVKMVTCVMRLPEQKGARRQAAEPHHFLLRAETTQLLSGVTAITCGFVDDSPGDNLGRLVLRVALLGPEDSSPPARAPLKSAEELSLEAAAAQESTEELYRTGRLLLRAKQLDQALIFGKECIRRDPRFAECHLLLGAVHASLKQVEEGANAYRKFVELAPSTHPQVPKVRELLEAFDKSKSKAP